MVRKGALEEGVPALQPEASSPSLSSGDAPEIPLAPPASRRKRPLESTADPKAAPPPKRERKDIDPPVHVVARAAWDALARRDPDRPDFRKDELVTMFADECQRLALSGRAVVRLKKQLGKFLGRTGMFQKSPRPDAPQDALIMLDPEYKHLRSRDPSRKGEGAKKAEQGSGASNGGDDVVMQDVPSRATVPTEWTAKSYKPVRLSPFDKSHAITFVGENKVKGLKGYRMIRGSAGVSEGDWYYECTVMPHLDGAVRLGWSMRRCDVETPVGFDAYGFGLRDRSGDFVHMARRKPYGEPFNVGDVIGCRIVLPSLSDEEKKAVADAEERWLQHRFVSFSQGPAPADSGVDITSQAKMEFFKNGKSMGIPALFPATPSARAELPDDKSILEASAGSVRNNESIKTTTQADGEVKKYMKAGVYYPSVALFRNAVVQANFGPDFKYSIPEGSRAMCDAASDKPEVEATLEKPSCGTEKDERQSVHCPKYLDNGPTDPEIVVVMAKDGTGILKKSSKDLGEGKRKEQEINDLDQPSEGQEQGAEALEGLDDPKRSPESGGTINESIKTTKESRKKIGDVKSSSSSAEGALVDNIPVQVS